MPIVQLNEDVLHDIISTLKRHDMLNFCATSRQAFDMTIPHFVSSVRLDRGDDQITGFCTFMLADPGKRIPMLQHFNLIAFHNFSDLQSQMTGGSLGLLADVLERATNLRSLALAHAEAILTVEPRIAAAVQHCTHLRCVHITDVGKLTRKIIQGLMEIRVIRLGLCRDVIPLLRPFRSTLEAAEFNITSELNREGFDEAGEWPLVRSLTIHLESPDLDKRMTGLSGSFPNVHELRLRPSEPMTISPSWNGPRQYWSILDYLEGSISSIYRMRLTCPIREMRVMSFITDDESTYIAHVQQTHALLDLVRMARPFALSFVIDLTRTALVGDEFFEQLASSAPSLRYLGLGVVYTNHVFKDVTSKLKILEDAGLSIVFLSLLVCGSAFSGPSCSAPDWQRVLEPLTCSMTSIKYVECVHGGTSLSPTIKGCVYWMVQATLGVDGNMRHSLSGISEDLGRQVKKDYSRTTYFRSERYMATE